MASEVDLHGKGPVFRTLTAIAALPKDQQFAALLERLDRLDEDEVNRIGTSKSGREYSMTNTTVRLSILEVGKKWIEERGEADGSGAHPKFAALRKFDAVPKKAG